MVLLGLTGGLCEGNNVQDGVEVTPFYGAQELEQVFDLEVEFVVFKLAAVAVGHAVEMGESEKKEHRKLLWVEGSDSF